MQFPDVDECLDAVENCHASAICKNTDGSFLCTCNQGYIGDGVNCEGITRFAFIKCDPILTMRVKSKFTPNEIIVIISFLSRHR